MKKKIIGIIIVMAMFVSSLPLSVFAQTRKSRAGSNSSETAKWTVGTDEYYRNDAVIFTGKKIPASSVNIHVGGDPQLSGGLTSEPAADEEDVALDRTIIVATKSGSGSIRIGPLEPTYKGKQIYVRRLKVSKKIIATINCGNWTREIGANYTFECQSSAGPCVPGETKTDTSETVSDDGKTKTTIVTTSNGCVTKIDKTVTITTVQTNNVCVPGAWVDVLEQGDSNGKLGKSFKVSEVISSLPAEVQSKITSAVGKEKINYLLVQQGACESEKQNIKVRWFSKSGGWNWVSFLVGVGVGFAIGYIVRGSPNSPVLNGIKSTNTAPVRTGATGSGSTSGGVVDTRPRKPQ